MVPIRRLLGPGLKKCPARFLGDPEHARGPVLVRILGVCPMLLLRQAPRTVGLEGIRDVRQEDQAEHYVLVLVRPTL